ncbi:MAG: hypothetical protein ACI9UA_003049, partial [Pseudoalteromonas tetraodonis]
EGLLCVVQSGRHLVDPRLRLRHLAGPRARFEFRQGGFGNTDPCLEKLETVRK